MKKHNNSGKKSEPRSKRTKSRGRVQRDTKEVLAELVEKLKEKLDPKKVGAPSAGEKHPSGKLRPNLDRLTVGVDLGDQESHYCILGLEGCRVLAQRARCAAAILFRAALLMVRARWAMARAPQKKVA